MKTHLLIIIALLSAAAPVMAYPYTQRALPAGFNAPYFPIFTFDLHSQRPEAADFLGNGMKQWYAGGTVISRFPESGTITLPAITLPVCPSCTVGALAGMPCDVDADGDMDIVRINGWNGQSFAFTLQVYVNNGSGSFSAGYRLDWTNQPSFDAGQPLFRIVPGDFNQDGFADLAVLEHYENANTHDTTPPYTDHGKLYVRWNDRTGRFPTTLTIQSTGFSQFAKLGGGDLDGDGDLDLVCSSHRTWLPTGAFDPVDYTDVSRVFTNDGSGAFASTALTLDLSSFADVNRNGRDEITGSRDIAYHVSGSGMLPGDPVVPFFSKSYIYADANGDAIPDLIQGNATTLMAYHGNGAGSFAQTGVTMSTFAREIAEIGAADGDGDGDTDFFISLKHSGQESATFVFLENRALHMLPGAYIAGSVAQSGVTGLHADDFNEDGIGDLLAVTPTQEKLWFMFGEADGIPAAGVFKLTQNEPPHSAAVADFDNDGRVDVAYTLPSTGQVRMARNTGNLPFSWADTTIATGLAGVSICVPGQLEAPNGGTDVLTGNGATGQVRWLFKQAGGTWAGQDVLTFHAPPPGALVAAQLTGNPGDEVSFLAANASSHALRSYQHNATWGTAGTHRVDSVTGGPHTVRMILATPGRGGRQQLIFITGDGALGVYHPVSGTNYRLTAAGAGVRDLAAVDWDLNGSTDILCATTTGLDLFSYNDSTGIWDRTALLTAAGGYTVVTALDLNHDRYSDAAVADGTQIHYVRNRPHVLEAAVTSTDVELPVGKVNNAALLDLTTAGRPQTGTWLNDASAITTGVGVSFHRALPSGGSYIRGAPLTKAEITAVTSSIALTGNGSTIGTTGAANYSDGQVSVLYNAALGTQVAVPAGFTVPHGIRFTVPSGALQAPVTRFILTINSLYGEELNGRNPVIPGGTLPVHVTGDTQVVVTIVPDYTPLQAWRADYFGAPDGTGLRANNADYDTDGVPNLVEYITGTNPAAAEPGLNTANALTVLPFASSGSALRLRFLTGNEAMTDPKVRVSVQISSGLTGWTTPATRTGGGPWTGLMPQSPVTGNYTNHLFTTTYTPANTTQLYARLKVEELP